MRLYLALALSCAACVLEGCSPPSRPPSVTDVDRGARLFEGSCVPCHQVNGQGIPGVYPSLAGSSLVQGEVAPLAAWVIEGRRPSQWPAGRYSTAMPTFGWLNEEDAAALFTYLRSHFGNSAPPVDAAAVAHALGH